MTKLVDALVAAVGELQAAVAPLPDAVNALEAAVTAAIKSGGLSQADQDALTKAAADIRAVAQGVGTAVADASDGVDEAA